MSKKKLMEALSNRPDLLERALLLVADAPPKRCSNPRELYEAVAPLLLGQAEEHLAVVALSRRNHVLAVEVLTRGNDAHTVVCPRQVFRWALQQGRSGATSVALAHNHPSGDAQFSREDIKVTERVAQAGAVLGIRLIDHIVVTDQTFASMAEAGFLPRA